MRQTLLVVLLLVTAAAPGRAEDAEYIGSRQCAECHAAQYESFMQHSRKAHAWKAVAVMKPKLKEHELKLCYGCHTTGYGRKGGFVDIESTPDLADVGCETCHGPGGNHAASGAPEDITRRPDVAACTVCHNPQRIEDFRFKPLIYSGAH